ncbi:acetyl-coenzyme A synthetase [Spatholobus suberectus]|nr:acetyl-coenzyme A synthetase [Spatholobus suberectus]
MRTHTRFILLIKIVIYLRHYGRMIPASYHSVSVRLGGVPCDPQHSIALDPFRISLVLLPLCSGTVRG